MERALVEGSLLQPRIKLVLQLYVGALVALLIFLFVVHAESIAQLYQQIWVFAPSGIIAAIIANSTGTGGGVVFVPAFSMLSGASEMGTIPYEISLKPINTIAVSFLIQCFGMSVGASVWIYKFYGGGQSAPGDRLDGRSFLMIILSVLVTSSPTLLITQFAFLGRVDGQMLLAAFKWSSLVLGFVLLAFTWTLRHEHGRRLVPEVHDFYWLLGLGALGGAVTAYFSVGVGELVVVYLLLRKFPTVAAVAIAVVVTAITVIAGVGYHIANDNIIWPVALMAIPGAMIGGFIARLFAMWLGPLWLKIFASVWIILSSAFLIAGPYLGWLP